MGSIKLSIDIMIEELIDNISHMTEKQQQWRELPTLSEMNKELDTIFGMNKGPRY